MLNNIASIWSHFSDYQLLKLIAVFSYMEKEADQNASTLLSSRDSSLWPYKGVSSNLGISPSS